MAKHERFYINVSNGCNLKCSHCFNNGGVIEGPLLPTPKIMQMVDQAVDSLGITEIQLTGGEPTQRYDIVPMIQGLHDRDLVVLLQTNGCFDQETAGIISRLADDTLGLIISLDGIETNDYFRGRGVTSKVIENIETLSNDISIRINTLSVRE